MCAIIGANKKFFCTKQGNAGANPPSNTPSVVNESCHYAVRHAGSPPVASAIKQRALLLLGRQPPRKLSPSVMLTNNSGIRLMFELPLHLQTVQTAELLLNGTSQGRSETHSQLWSTVPQTGPLQLKASLTEMMSLSLYSLPSVWSVFMSIPF